jgi:hypothetical protein
MKEPNPKDNSFLEEASQIRESDILSQLTDDKGPSLFLGKYSMNEVIAVLRKRNFLKEAQKRNLWPLSFNLDSSEFPLQRYQIFYREKDPQNMIVDLKIREGRFRMKDEFALKFLSSEYEFLILEWLTLQNPLQDFSPERAPLPGQNHPGLNLGKKVLDIFVYLARLTKKDGLLACPAYFHNALLFSRQFSFINPEKEGEVHAIRKSFPQVSFKDLAWIVHLNCLKGKNKETFEWRGERQVYPINKTLRKYFDSKAYKDKVKESQKSLIFTIDWRCYKIKAEKVEM